MSCPVHGGDGPRFDALTPFDGSAPPRIDPVAVDTEQLAVWIDSLQPRGVNNWQELAAADFGRAFVASDTMRYDIIRDLYEGFRRVVAEKGDAQDFRRLMEPILREKGWLSDQPGEIGRRLELIYDANLRNARAVGKWRRQQRSKQGRPYLRYSAVLDRRVRPTHAALHGIIRPIDDPFWRSHYPPNGFNSLVPWQRVSGAAHLGLKAFYSGQIVEIVGASGGRMTVTAHHPVLTSKGWVDAQQVGKGDQLLAYRADVVGGTPTAELDPDNAPPTIKQVFDALGLRARCTVPRAAVHLNGDVDFIEGDIDVVGANRQLVDAVQSTSRQFLQKFDFVSSDAAFKAILGYCAASLVGIADGRRVGDLGGLGGPLSYRFGSVLEFDRSPTIHFDPISGQVSGYVLLALAITAGDVRQAPALRVKAGDILGHLLAKIGTSAPDQFTAADLGAFRFGAFGHTPLAEVLVGSFGVNPNAHRTILDTQAGAVQTDEVVDVRLSNYSGHVYDLQTASGTIAAFGGYNKPQYIVSNCRCVAVALTRSQAARYGGVTDELETQRRAIENPPDRGWGFNIGAEADLALERKLAEVNAGLLPGQPRPDADAARRRGAAAWTAVIAALGLLGQ